jgi:hypothetical protein
MGKLIGSAMAVFSILMVSVLVHAADSVAGKGDGIKIEPVSFTILNPDNNQVIGRAQYKTENRNGRILIWGENLYKNGEHDVERDELAFGGRNTLLVLENFEHTFFNADGSKKLTATANPRSGEASCISYDSGQKHEVSKKLKFPSDTYVGAAAVVAMEKAFREGQEHIAFHTFDCAPEPVLAAVTAERGDTDEYWASYPGPLIQVKLTAQLGWVGDLLGSLVPHRSAWFNPSRGWQYVGGKIQRYLATGPQVILVRDGSAQAEAVSDAR